MSFASLHSIELIESASPTLPFGQAHDFVESPDAEGALRLPPSGSPRNHRETRNA